MVFRGGFKRTDINDGVERFKKIKGAILLDVRTKGEYAEGHIEGSINIPLREIESAERIIPDKDTPIFIYCLSGARSAQAMLSLKGMGYKNGESIGGIQSFRGKVEK